MKQLKPKGRRGSCELEYSKITDQVYVGSDFCCGRDCRDHAEEFKKLGVSVEISLTAEKKEIPPDNLDLYSWMPIVDECPPTPDQFDLGVAIINQAVKNGKTVYVHCINGHGRSPTMVAAYLIRHKGMDVDEAIDFIAKKRLEVHVEDVQREALKEFAKK